MKRIFFLFLVVSFFISSNSFSGTMTKIIEKSWKNTGYPSSVENDWISIDISFENKFKCMINDTLDVFAAITPIELPLTEFFVQSFLNQIEKILVISGFDKNLAGDMNGFFLQEILNSGTGTYKFSFSAGNYSTNIELFNNKNLIFKIEPVDESASDQSLSSAEKTEINNEIRLLNLEIEFMKRENSSVIEELGKLKSENSALNKLVKDLKEQLSKDKEISNMQKDLLKDQQVMISTLSEKNKNLDEKIKSLNSENYKLQKEISLFSESLIPELMSPLKESLKRKEELINLQNATITSLEIRINQIRFDYQKEIDFGKGRIESLEKTVDSLNNSIWLLKKSDISETINQSEKLSEGTSYVILNETSFKKPQYEEKVEAAEGETKGKNLTGLIKTPSEVIRYDGKTNSVIQRSVTDTDLTQNIEKTDFFEGGWLMTSQIVYFNEFGLPERIVIFKNGLLTEEYKNEYDIYGKLISTRKSENGKYSSRKIFTFDEKGNLKSEKTFDSKDKIVDYTENHYSENSILLFSLIYDGNGIETSKISYEFDEWGRLIKNTYYSGIIKKGYSVNSYDASGRMERIDNYDENNKLLYYSIFIYN